MLRPVVPVSIVGADVSSPVWGLVDSGCSYILAAPWLQSDAGLHRSSSPGIKLGLGGEVVYIRFVPMVVRLHAPGPGNDDLYIEWEEEVGFLKHWKPTFQMLLGQSFLQRFTVTMSRHAQTTAVEDREAFDQRFGTVLAN